MEINGNMDLHIFVILNMQIKSFIRFRFNRDGSSVYGDIYYKYWKFGEVNI